MKIAKKVGIEEMVQKISKRVYVDDNTFLESIDNVQLAEVLVDILERLETIDPTSQLHPGTVEPPKK